MQLGLVSDSELYGLCRCGAARFYETWGVYETQFSWEPDGDSKQEALQAEKYRLAPGGGILQGGARKLASQWERD